MTAADAVTYGIVDAVIENHGSIAAKKPANKKKS